MAQLLFPEIVPGTTTGSTAATNLNKGVGSTARSIKVVSEIAQASDEAGYYATGVILYSIAEDAFYKYNGNAWVVDDSIPTTTNLPAKVRATLLTGLSTATKATITATDSVLSAFGKLQAYITDVEEHLPYLSAGVYGTSPTLTDNGDGTATISSCDVLIYSTSDYTGLIDKFTVAEDTFTFTDGAEEYVAVSYNSGTPIYYKETVGTDINNSDILPIFTVWRQGTVIHSLSFDSLGIGLSNKLQSAAYHTHKYSLSSDGGMVISETTSPNPRTVLVSAGLVYTGAIPQSVLAFDSSTDLLTLAYHSSSVWNYSNNLVYNNTQYDNGTNLASIPSNKYAVRWFYRSIGDTKQVFYVLGSSYYNSVADAETEQPRTDLPTLIKNHCMLVGRSIVQLNATSGVMQSSFGIAFAGVSVINHNDTANKQGGTTDEYYHLTSAQNTAVGNLGTISSQNANAVNISGGVVNATINNATNPPVSGTQSGAGPSGKFGDGTNQSVFESDGTLRFDGTATIYEDLLPSSIATGGGVNAPSFTAYNGNLRAYEFVGTGPTTKELNIGFQLSHSYKEGTTITPHVHLYIPDDATGGTIKFYCEYTWTNVGSTGAVATTTISGTLVRNANAGIANNALLSLGDVVGTGKTISSMFMCRIYRDPTDVADTFGASVWLKSADIHIEMDTIGSRTPTAK